MNTKIYNVKAKGKSYGRYQNRENAETKLNQLYNLGIKTAHITAQIRKRSK